MNKLNHLKIVICTLLTLSLNSFAQEAKDIHIQSLDDNLDPKQISAEVNTHTFKELKNSLKTKLPHPKELNSLFTISGLSTEVKGMDQIDRDLLYLKAKKNKLEDLKKSYPKISESKLSQFKKNIENKK